MHYFTSATLGCLVGHVTAFSSFIVLTIFEVLEVKGDGNFPHFRTLEASWMGVESASAVCKKFDCR